MRIRWRLILPTIGLLLFAGETRHSYREWQIEPQPRRYFWWAFIRLDSDPLNRHPHPLKKNNVKENNGGWELRGKIVDPGYLTQTSLLSGFPAFLLSKLIRNALSRFGISQVLSFMISTPILLAAWY